jgi:hypothetical protein
MESERVHIGIRPQMTNVQLSYAPSLCLASLQQESEARRQSRHLAGDWSILRYWTP